jgi:polyvinyl alcohol dehydrogenase (cytochrome)
MRKLFEVQVPGAVEGTPIIADNNGVYFGTVAGTAYVVPQDRSAQGSGAPDGGIVTGAKGLIFWATYVGGPIRGSMLKVGDSVYAVANPIDGPRLVAMDPLTGDIKWSTVLDDGPGQRGVNSCAGPQYAQSANLIIVGLTDCQGERSGDTSNSTIRGAVVAVDATTGAVRWKSYTTPFGTTGAGVHGTPAVWDNQSKVYVVTGHAYNGVAGPYTDSILQLDLATGSILKSFQSHAGDNGASGPVDPQHAVGFTSTPILVGRTVPYVGVGGDDGKYYLVNALTMQQVAATQVQLPGNKLGIVNGSAWGMFKGTGKNGTIFGMTQTPSYFFGINPENGGISPIFPSASGLPGGPVTLSHDYVWQANLGGTLDLYSADDGHVAWRIPVGTPTTSGVSFYQERAFVALGIPGGVNGGLVAYEVPKK